MSEKNKQNKKQKHPNYGLTTYVDTKGNEIQINSCLVASKKFLNGQNKFYLQSDINTHPAWTKNSKNLSVADNIKKITKSYKGFEDF
mgnify:CR=1 FL=1